MPNLTTSFRIPLSISVILESKNSDDQIIELLTFLLAQGVRGRDLITLLDQSLKTKRFEVYKYLWSHEEELLSIWDAPLFKVTTNIMID